MNNINLLPPDDKQRIEQKKKNSNVVNIFIKSIFIFILIALVSGATWFMLEGDSGVSDEILESKESIITQYGSLENDAKVVAEKLTTIKTIEKGANTWSGVMTEIQNMMPSGTYLSKITMSDSKNIRSEISGFSKTKASIATLRDAMEGSEYFEYVDIESTTTTKDNKTDKDVESFTLSFSLAEGALNE